ncbi:MAG: hypothetical protein KAI17_08845, partial [Thiotrichaceae bacterium]|nr:hypothetical protein [Thiotrichaceae bacterium]
VWRHALINFPHPFLKQGLNILDTPGLNSLGNEPELTISMLPNAQAAIFVLAADTGVTRSDMDIWRRHLKSFRRNRNNGLIVALNKIDTLWDDLKTDKEISASIQRQCLESSKTLGIDSKHVFAVSAQKGLLGRIREDEELVEKSNLTLLETILAQDILPQKQSLVRNTIINDIVDLMKNSRIILFGQFNARKKSLASFGGMSGKNENIILELLQQTREEQKNYQINAENLHASRKILLGERKKLNNIISLEKLDKHISKSRTMMKGSWTTNGMKSSMKLLFDGLTNTITEADKQVELTNRLINSIYTRFKKENEDIGVNLEPKLFSINSYKQEIELLYADAEEYRTSVYSTLKEQSFVIKKFFISLVSRARNIYYQLNHDSDHWAKTTLTPLVHQVKAHKQELQTRMLQLKKAGDSRDSITEQVTTITREAKILQKQLIELNAMINIVSAPILVNNIQPEQSTTTK